MYSAFQSTTLFGSTSVIIVVGVVRLPESFNIVCQLFWQKLMLHELALPDSIFTVTIALSTLTGINVKMPQVRQQHVNTHKHTYVCMFVSTLGNETHTKSLFVDGCRYGKSELQRDSLKVSGCSAQRKG